MNSRRLIALTTDRKSGKYSSSGPCIAAIAFRSCPLWAIHVIHAIPPCPVRPKSGHSANVRVYEYVPYCNGENSAGRKMS
ncbi:MAG TPA: hypothetical protein VGJ68_07055, partial [Bradyrhizobium sp.]